MCYYKMLAQANFCLYVARNLSLQNVTTSGILSLYISINLLLHGSSIYNRHLGLKTRHFIV